MKPLVPRRCLLALGGLLLLAPWGRAAAPAMPMPIPEPETATHRWLRKPVLGSRLLDDMEQTNHWSHHGQGQMSLTSQRARDGKQSVRLTAATKTERPNKVTGRPFGEAVARRDVAGEDWREFNRLAFWVYPHLPGFKVISLLVKLRNEGPTKVPDSYGREGLNYFLLQPDTWNQVVWEIPHLARDKVTGVEFIYRLQGHEPGATNAVCFDLDQLELQRVEADPFEGWTVAPGRIACSHSGYPPQASKVALASGLKAKKFEVISQATGRSVLGRAIETRRFDVGELQVLDFTQITKPGLFRLVAGDVQTPWFPIADDAWNESIWKTINFFFCERCGWAVPGIHDVCHQDWRARHGERTIVINGGWHDAGDLSQGLVNTTESTGAMLTLAERLSSAAAPAGNLPASSPSALLASSLMSEARWGLDWILKTRFGDGSRVTWATMDYWTDGELGTADDTFGDVGNGPFDNFMAASTEALAGRLLRSSSSLAAAREDWQFAVDRTRSPNLELAAAGALASIELFKATGEQPYADKAMELATVIVNSQQRESPPWRVPLTGFFYTGPRRDRILHYSHRGHEQAPIVALAALCELFPDHADWINWYSAVVLHCEYLKRIAQFTEPWGLLPASVYSLDESGDARFQEQVRNGIALSERHYLRRFPVWFDFRGNCGTVLSQTKALSTAARLRGDKAAAALVQRQLEWTVGRNPFCQSLMFGEGHDYAPQYTAMSGDMAGSLPVGIQTRENRDVPYWPAANCYNYKEVWVHPSARWLAILADLVAPTPPGIRPVVPAIEVTDVQAQGREGVVTIKATVRGQGRHRVTLRASNLGVESPEQSLELKPRRAQTLAWTARIVSTNEPWVAVVVPGGARAGWKDAVAQ